MKERLFIPNFKKMETNKSAIAKESRKWQILVTKFLIINHMPQVQPLIFVVKVQEHEPKGFPFNNMISPLKVRCWN